MLTLLLAAATAFSSPKLTVQDTSQIKQKTLSEIEVIEYKQNKHVLTPTSVSVVTTPFIQQNNIYSLKELTGIMPNFFMPDYGAKQNSPVYIRGIGTKTKNPAIGFYVDDIPHFENSAFDIDVYDLADVEVFRGPQGTLYGRNAIGGIISVHTKSPLEYQGTSIRLGYGSHNDVRAGLSHYAKVSDAVGYAIAAGYHHNDGFFKNHTTGHLADDIDEGYARLSLVWKPSDLWTFKLNNMLDLSKQGGYPYGKRDAETGKTLPVDYNRYSSYKRLINTSGFNARYADDRISFNSQTAFQYIKDYQEIDQDFGPKDLFFVINKLKQNMLSQEFTLKSNHYGRLQWIAGLFGMLQKVDNNIEVQYLTKNMGLPAHTVTPIKATAAYLQGAYELCDGLSLTAGIRFDYEYAQNTYDKKTHKLRGDSFDYKTIKSFDSDLHHSQVTPKLSLQYRTPSQNQLFYASIARGYKAGGFNQSMTKDSERTYKPEYSINYEAGAKLKYPQIGLTTELALFFIDCKDRQTNHTVPGEGNILYNAGHSQSKGVELSATYAARHDLFIHLNYGYTDAKFIKYEQNDKDFSGKKMPLVPESTLGLHATYMKRWDNAFIDEIKVNGGITAVGDIYWTEDNKLKQPFYALLNANVELKKGPISWNFWGKNLTNTVYNTYTFVSSAAFAQQGKPAAFGTSLTYRF